MAGNCPFCDLDRPVVLSRGAAVAVRDAFPVSKGHTLIFPRAHVSSLLDLENVEYRDVFQLVLDIGKLLQSEFKADGINIGVNVGRAAGQTVDHAHVHVIPRYTGDVPDPRGGVRGVIPAKQKY